MIRLGGTFVRPIRRFAVLLVPLVLIACRSAGIAECTENGECPAEQVCNRHTRLCYKPDPFFAVQIIDPTPNETVGTLFRLTGTVANASAGVSSLEYRIGDGGWTPLQASASGHFEAYPPLPPANGDPLAVVVHATDGSGRETNSAVNVLVDNVGPIATLTAADSERNHPLNVAVQFSEPVLPNGTASDVPLTVTPDPGPGEWNASRTEYRLANLQPDTVYLAQVAANAVRDAAGNLSQETHASFRTAPLQPPDGFVIAPAKPSEHFDQLDAISDQDGVVTLAAHASSADGGEVIWGWFDPATGGFVSHALATPVVAALSVGASVDDPLGAPRMHTLTVRVPLPDGGLAARVFWSTDGGVQSQFNGALVVVPGPPGCGEAGPADSVGLATDAGVELLYRRGSEALPLGIDPQFVTYAAPSHWSVVTADGGSVIVQEPVYHCDTLQAPSLASPRVIATSPTGSPVSNVSAASVASNALFAFNSAGDWYATCARCISGAASCQLPAQSDLKVASMHDGDRVLGAKRDGTTFELSLVSADLAQTCPPAVSDWTQGAVLPGSDSVTYFQPTMFGRTPGLVYVDGQGQLVVAQSASP